MVNKVCAGSRTSLKLTLLTQTSNSIFTHVQGVLKSTSGRARKGVNIRFNTFHRFNERIEHAARPPPQYTNATKRGNSSQKNKPSAAVNREQTIGSKNP